MTLIDSVSRWLPAVRTVLTVAGVNLVVAVLLSPLVINSFLDILVSAQVIGFTLWLPLRAVMRADLKPWVRGIALSAALTFGAMIGTMLVNLVKGRSIVSLDEEGLVRYAFTVMLGVVIGAVVTGVWFARSTIARTEAELMRSEAERQRLARQQAESELAVIRAQIEPHFLFNTLANLSYLIKDNPTQAQAMLENLIDYLQAAVPRIRGESATLRAELSMATSYVSILQIRMGNRLRASFDVPNELLGLAVPPMMLVTLVENAIKHGLGELAEGGELHVTARRSANLLTLSVADTGVGLTATGAPLRPGFGLENIRERLTAMFGERGKLVLEANQPRGVVATLEIPVQCSAH